MHTVRRDRFATTGLLLLSLFAGGLVLPRILSRVEASHARRHPSPNARKNRRSDLTAVEVIVPAYLEANVIGTTIQRLREQFDATDLKSSIAVIASDQETANASSGADRVELVPRNGKPAALNVGVAGSAADVVVLMDGNCTLVPDEWPSILLQELESADVVSALKSETGGHDGLFWRLEDWIKSRQPAEVGTLAVVGEFVAMRREDYVDVPEDVVLDDLWIARTADAAGRLVRVTPRIRTVEKAVEPSDQWERRTRNAEGQFRQGWSAVWAYRRTPAGRMFLGHKLYRYTIGPLAFWSGLVCCAAAMGPRYIVAGGALAARSVLEYAGRTRHRFIPSLFSTTIGLQAVPFAGAIRATRHAFRARQRPAEPYRWQKVVR